MSDNDKYSLIANDNLQQTQHIQGFGTTYSQQAPPYYPNAPPHMNPTPVKYAFINAQHAYTIHSKYFVFQQFLVSF